MVRNDLLRLFFCGHAVLGHSCVGLEGSPNVNHCMSINAYGVFHHTEGMTKYSLIVRPAEPTTKVTLFLPRHEKAFVIDIISILYKSSKKINR